MQLSSTIISFRHHLLVKKLFRQLQTHFERLGLANRYRVNALDHLRVLRHPLKRFYGDERNAERVSNKLTEIAIDYELERGRNHWQAVLYRELASHSEFCDGGFVVLDHVQ